VKRLINEDFDVKLVVFIVVVEIEIGMFVSVDGHEEIVDGEEEIVVVSAYGNRVIEVIICCEATICVLFKSNR